MRLEDRVPFGRFTASSTRFLRRRVKGVTSISSSSLMSSMAFSSVRFLCGISFIASSEPEVRCA